MTAEATRRPVCLISGAGSDIGRGISVAVARRGFDVALLDVNAPALATASAAVEADAPEARVLPLNLDLLSPDVGHMAMTAVLETFGRIDGLVNNAAAIRPGLIEDCTERDFDLVMKVNVWAPLVMARAAAKAMASNSDGGAIVNVASMAGHYANPLNGIYGISKAAALALTRELAIEWSAAGVRCNSISPGPMSTTMRGLQLDQARQDHRATLVPLGRLGLPADAGRLCAFLVSPDSSWLTGIDVLMDGGLSLTLMGNLGKPPPDAQVAPDRM